MQTTIEKLWSGELAPCAQKERKHKEVRELVVMLEQYKRELEKGSISNTSSEAKIQVLEKALENALKKQ